MTSAERIIQFARLAPETDTVKKTLKSIVANEPVKTKFSTGTMKFKNVDFRYFDQKSVLFRRKNPYTEKFHTIELCF